MMRLFHMVMFYTNCRITTGIFITSLPKHAGSRPAGVTIIRARSLDIKKRYI